MSKQGGGMMTTDPRPWRHIDGVRVSDPWSPDAPRGGYTFDPRPGYSDYPERFISTRVKVGAGR